MDPRQVTPTVPPQSIHSKRPRSYNNITFLILVLLFILVGTVITYTFQNYQQLSQSDLPLPEPTVTLTPTPSSLVREGIVKNNEVFTIGLLQFEAPENWYYKQSKNPYFGDDWFQLDPSGRTDFPLFTLKVRDALDSVDNLNSLRTYAIDAHYLTKYKEEQITISGIKGYIISGIPAPPTGPGISCGECYLGPFFKINDSAKIVVFYNQRSYIFLGPIQEYGKEFDQILSSFQFVEPAG
jgi:hypothetical protein